MTKYARIYHFVCRLTEDPTWRAFFISLLLAETDAERKAIDKRFWEAVKGLNETEQQKIREDFDRNFLQLLPMAKELSKRVDEVQVEHAALAA